MLNIDLYNSSYFLELDDSTIYGIREGSDIGIPGAQRIYQAVWGKGYAPPSAVDYGNRQASLEVLLKGTSLDNLIVNYRQLETILLQAQEYWTSKGLAGDRAFLSIQLNGMTYPIEYEILDGELGAGGIFQHIVRLTSAPVLAKIPLSLTLRPWGRPQALTRVTSGSLNNGGGTGATGGTYSMAAPVGDVAAPVKVSISNTLESTYYPRLILARRTVGNVANFAALWPIQCETTGGTGYTITNIEASGNFSLSNEADAAASGGSVLRLTHTNVGADTLAPILRVTINDNLSDFYGRFRVYMRIATGNANMTGAQIRYGGTGADITVPAVNMTTLWGGYTTNRLFDLGEIQIPSTAMAPDRVLTAFNFQLYGTFAQSNFTEDFDCFYLVPVDEERLDIPMSTAIAAAADIFVDDHLAIRPEFYVTDSTGVYKINNPSSVVVPVKTHFHWVQGKVNLWLPLFVEIPDFVNIPTIHYLTQTLTITVDGFPQYALLR